MQLLTALVALLAVAAHAVPTVLDKRATTCGKKSYSTTQITAAANAACNYVREGTTAGSSDYPHEYHDREGFSFHGVSGPYYEFPLKSGGVYSGGECLVALPAQLIV